MNRALLLIGLGISLAGCARSPGEDRALELAQRMAAMPNCPSIHVDWTVQRPIEDEYALYGRFTSTPACMREWEKRLAESDFEPQLPHGEWIRKRRDGSNDLVSSSSDGRSRGIYLRVPQAVEGVEMIERIE